jgi:uncharacterized protein YceK
MIRFFLISASLMALAGCGEFDQSTDASRSYPNDTPPWQGTKNAYMERGWTAGDKASWENQLRTRSQAQNEYVKTN